MRLEHKWSMEQLRSKRCLVVEVTISRRTFEYLNVDVRYDPVTYSLQWQLFSEQDNNIDNEGFLLSSLVTLPYYVPYS